jgi:syntaxin 5
MPIAMGPLPSTSGRDRTSEFHAIVDRLKKTQGATLPYVNGANGSAANGNGETARLLPQPSGNLQSEFSKRASQIGLSIHQTSQKLSKLAKCKLLIVVLLAGIENSC